MSYGTYGRDTLIDPAPGGLGEYVFQVGHSDEEEFGTGRQLTVTSNTAGGLAVFQQGDDEPLILTLHGTILHKNQHEKLIAYTKKSRDHTLIFRDFFGEEYEVIVASYKTARKRTMRNPRDTGMLLHTHSFTLVLSVVGLVQGAWLSE